MPNRPSRQCFHGKIEEEANAVVSLCNLATLDFEHGPHKKDRTLRVCSALYEVDILRGIR